ncbi:MAG: ligase-associated DNA damage response DEXH box helicase [Phycisphaerales bacterium]
MDVWEKWFTSRNWKPFEFQREVWRAYADGASGLLHAPTGAGKTYAVLGGPIREWLSECDRHGNNDDGDAALRVLWITPLRALANDTANAIRGPLNDLDLPWKVELRTGDTTATARQRQIKSLPTVLITTPESLSLLFTHPGAQQRFASLRSVVVDEWHELLGSKRGVQTELCLAHLRSLVPHLRTWGLSATLGNLDEALSALTGSREQYAIQPRLVRGEQPKTVTIQTLLPETLERFPWAGHIGLRLLPQLIDVLEESGSTLIFTNTRSQTEIWYHELLKARPDWLGEIAIHHGSLDREIRERVEAMLANGELRAVVCTSSLDLGVDFTPVERIVQIGSPKGIARLLQRAGRSGHQPGAVSCAIGLPTNALELVEYAAARDAIAASLQSDASELDSHIEQRSPIRNAMDVLAQHLVTIGMGDGFAISAMQREVMQTHAYATLTEASWQWVIDFVQRGGDPLAAYPQFARLVERDGLLRVESRDIARLHRMSIGTITSDTAVRVRYARGSMLGTIEESFIERLRPGDRFAFAGRVLELVRYRDLTATVRNATRTSGTVPRWNGGRSPLSTELARAIRARLDQARHDIFDCSEMQLVRPLLELQARWSVIPAHNELLIECTGVRGIHHVFIFSFAGRLVHEGLAALIAWRITQARKCTIHVSSNDYGFELSSRDPLDFTVEQWHALLSPHKLLDDLIACLNATAMARRRFRSIAQIAGLVFPGYPGQFKTNRQIQASSDLFFDVFAEFDPDNQLLSQSKREVLEAELEYHRLNQTLERLATESITLMHARRVSPLAFPLWVESLRSQDVSSESWSDRVHRMVEELELAASQPMDHTQCDMEVTAT